MVLVFGLALVNFVHSIRVANSVSAGSGPLNTPNSFGQLFHVKVHPPPAQDRSLRGQHKINNRVFDFSLLCADGIPLLMEDHKPRPCQPRPWLKEQRCPTGFWCHEGQSEYSYYCCPSSRKFANRCHLPPAVGYGKQRMRRFYFDWKTDACHELQYSGIGGNENSFMNYEKCEQVCRGAGEPPIMLPSNMKIMSQETTKDVKKQEKPEKDKKMVYPKEAAAPVSLQPPAAPNTKPDDVYEAFYTAFPKSTYNTNAPPTTTTLSTTPITRTTTTEAAAPEVFDPNPCSLAPDKGLPGAMTVNMWYYDPISTTCSPFMYLGKGGNSNRFGTSEECVETCGIGKPKRKSCELPPAIGNGPFNIPRYYFDRVTKKCERFFYSGRDGNDNRFYKKNKCEKLCLKKKPKKKENIFEFTSTPSTPLINHESTPMRIIQNLIPSKPKTKQTTSNLRPNTADETSSDPYAYATPTPTQAHVTVESWIEGVTDKSNAYEYSTTPHPTLIYEPRGETLPTIVPPSTTVPSIVDHVFSSLMNTQHQKLVEFGQVPPAVQKQTSEAPRRFSSQETIPFGEVEQQPVPMTAYGSLKPTVNQYGMKVEPYQTTDYVLPPGYPSTVYFPQPAYPEVKSNSSVVLTTAQPEKLTSSASASVPISTVPSSVNTTSNPQNSYVSQPISVSNSVVGPIPPPSQSVTGTNQPDGSLNAQSPNVDHAPVPPSQPITGSVDYLAGSTDYLATNATRILSPSQPAPVSTPAPAPPSFKEVVPGSIPPPSPIFPAEHSVPHPTHYVIPSQSSPQLYVIPNPVPTLSPTAGPPPSFNIYPFVSLPPPSTTVPPIPTLLPPNISYVTSPPDNNDSPCSRPLYGDATIMCENRQEICPMGTFCQIGQGQSICCPIMEEPPCEQVVEEGMGNVLLRRWYFDPTTRLCQPFYYKGFKGNQNNFQSSGSCNRACGATNVCPAGSPQMPIHTHLLSCNSEFDCPYSHDCVQSTPHNICCSKIILPLPQPAPAPPAASIEAPLQPVASQVSQPHETNIVIDFIEPATHSSNNLCLQPIDMGFGGLSEHRWAFSSGQCTSFLYSGQGGNMNNFLTRNDCIRTCQSPIPSPSSQCSQPAASGHGEQYLSRYFFSPEYRQCLHFIYSGDGGNENNFESLTECLEECVAKGVKFSSLASNPMSVVPLPAPTFLPSPLEPATSTTPFPINLHNVCPQGDPLITVDGTPIQCDPSKAAKCPGDHICTPRGREAYCCPSPMNFCLQSRPAISVCSGPDFEPVREIRFTYDPMADRCVRFSYQNCRSTAFSPSGSLNNFVTNSQCNRLCCNQGYDLVYRRRLLMAMNDDPITDEK